MKSFDNIDAASVGRMMVGLSPVMWYPSWEDNNLVIKANISVDDYVLHLYETEKKIKNWCRTKAQEGNSTIINIQLNDFIDKRREIDTWPDGFTQFFFDPKTFKGSIPEILTPDHPQYKTVDSIAAQWHPLAARPYIDAKVKHLELIIQYIKTLIGFDESNSKLLPHQHQLPNLEKPSVEIIKTELETVALLYHYLIYGPGKHNIDIPAIPENWAQLAAKYGHNSKTSGKKLRDSCNKYRLPKNRNVIDSPNNKKHVDTKIKRAESVVRTLEGLGLNLIAESALKDLNSLYSQSKWHPNNKSQNQ